MMTAEILQKPDAVRRISPEIDVDRLSSDLEQLQKKALDMGAVDSMIVQQDDIIFNSEIFKRINSDNNHISIHWPLFYPKDDIQEAIRLYKWGIFFRMDIDKNFPDYGGGLIANEKHRQIFLKIYEISAAIESAGFYMGYHLSLGLAAGNCRSVFCADEKRCWPMIRGKVCVHPNKGRPSMEAAGIDAAAIAKKMKWKLDENAKCPILAGLVMIV